MTTYRRHPAIATALPLALAISGVVLTACGSSSGTPRSTTPQVAHHTTAGVTASATGVAAAPSTTAAIAHSAAPVASTATACQLVTEAEISAALGTDPGHGSAFTSHGSSQCQYGSYQTKFVLVNLTPTRGRAGYDLMHQGSRLHNAVDLPGVGDRALEISAPGTAGIYFNKGDALVVVTVVIHAAGSPPASQALALAKIAANRL